MAPPVLSRSVYLTFDDGPHTELTPRILDLLHERGARATFFVVGMKATGPIATKLLGRMTREGHTIANHSFSHRNLTSCEPQSIREEILSTEKVLEGFASFRRLFRPPYGKTNSTVLDIAHQLGYDLILWNNDPRDWACRTTPDAWVTNALAAVKTRDARLIVCHDTHRHTADHLPQLLDELTSDGYMFDSLATPEAATTATQLESSHNQPSS